jgi:hypothetical protein
MSHDYVPTVEREILPFARNLYGYALANYARWGVPSPQTTLETAITAFETAMTAFQQPNHGKVDTLTKNDGKNTLIHALRGYIQGYAARNPAVTDEDREKMGFPLRDSTSTRRPGPDIRAETEAEPTGKGARRVTAVTPHTQSKDKPHLVSGVAFARRVRNPAEPKSRAEDMPSDYQTSTSRTYQYTEEDYGKAADYATAYENSTGQRGPWSNVTSLLISG